MASQDLFSMGWITGSQGLKGKVRVKADVESVSAFPKGSDVRLVARDKEESVLKVQSAVVHGKGLLIAFDGVETREQSDRLKGAELYVHRDMLGELDDNTWYWEDLIGLDVKDTNDNYLGKLTSVFPTGSNDVYVVKNGKEEILVPALEWVVISVDLEAGVMTVDLPEGL